MCDPRLSDWGGAAARAEVSRPTAIDGATCQHADLHRVRSASFRIEVKDVVAMFAQPLRAR